MLLRVIRDVFTENYTGGKLYINNVYQCFTLEDVDRKLESGGVKIYGKTAIPRGKYTVLIGYSNRFKKQMIRVVGVSGYSGVLIHSGNTENDTDGCILVGNGRGTDKMPILDSRAAINKLFEIVEEALDRGENVEIIVE